MSDIDTVTRDAVAQLATEGEVVAWLRTPGAVAELLDRVEQEPDEIEELDQVAAAIADAIEAGEHRGVLFAADADEVDPAIWPKVVELIKQLPKAGDDDEASRLAMVEESSRRVDAVALEERRHIVAFLRRVTEVDACADWIDDLCTRVEAGEHDTVAKASDA